MQVKSNGSHLGQDSVQPQALREGEKQAEEENQDQEMWMP